MTCFSFSGTTDSLQLSDMYKKRKNMHCGEFQNLTAKTYVEFGIALRVIGQTDDKLVRSQISLESPDGKRPIALYLGAWQDSVSEHKMDHAGGAGIHDALTLHHVCL